MSLFMLDYKEQVSFSLSDRLQKELVNLMLTGFEHDFLLLLSHKPVITVGCSGKQEHILASKELLDREGIEVYYVDRGGDVTYHGPGQLVGYPIINLSHYREDPSWYVNCLEEVIIYVLRHFNLSGSRKKNDRGVWVKDKKIASIGVATKRKVVYHGFSLNVRPILKHFSYIMPCGMSSSDITSMHSLLSADCPTIEEVKQVLVRSFLKVFEVDSVFDYNACSSMSAPQKVSLPVEMLP